MSRHPLLLLVTAGTLVSTVGAGTAWAESPVIEGLFITGTQSATFEFSDPVGDNPAGVDIGDVIVGWEAGGPLSLAVTLANVEDTFSAGQWVEAQLDADIDGMSDFLVHAGEPFGNDPNLCVRTSSTTFDCSSNPGVTATLDGHILTMTVDSGLVNFGDTLRFSIVGLDGFPIITAFDFAGPWIVPTSVDSVPPVIEVALDPIVVWASTPEGNDMLNLLSFVRAIDAVDPNPRLECSPAGFFPIGETQVTCGAVDNAGNWTYRVLTVVVLGPGDILRSTADTIRDLQLAGSRGIAASLDSVAQLIDSDRTGPACRMLHGLGNAVTSLTHSGTEFPDWPMTTIDYVSERLLECTRA